MKRLGIIGFNTASGLGVVNRQLCDFLPVTSWMVSAHKHFRNLTFPWCVQEYFHIGEFLDSIDILLFAETPLRINLQNVKRKKKRIVCIMMQEWLPKNLKSWPALVDLFICPTEHGYNQYKHILPCVYFPWPVDTIQFPFLKKEKCRKFLFINGRGGWKNRKGADIICKVKSCWPDMPLVVYSQSNITNWPSGTDIRNSVSNSSKMYLDGDVLLAPHRADGIGLELLEAASSGLPLIATSGQPWNEFPLLAAIPSTARKRVIYRNVDWYEPNPKSLINICKKLLDNSIHDKSQNIRNWAENRSWNNLYYSLQKIIEG